MDYRKFMQDTWVEWEDEILHFFKDHKVDDFKKCPKVCRAMVYEGGDLQTERIQGWHLWNYHKHTGKSIHDVESFIEVGGGYGMMCKIIKSCNDAPYNIVDLPIINSIQQYFLSDIDNVNYIGLDKLESAKNLSCDMFISMCALTETSDEMIKYVTDRNFFYANNIFVAFRKKDTKDYCVEKFMPTLEKFGNIVEMDNNHFYLVK